MSNEAVVGRRSSPPLASNSLHLQAAKMAALQFVICALSFLLLAACGTSAKNPHAGERYAVNTSRTQFYKYGPAQATGPDFALYKGQQVTMLRRAFGYSQVTTDDGQAGYV